MRVVKFSVAWNFRKFNQQRLLEIMEVDEAIECDSFDNTVDPNFYLPIKYEALTNSATLK